MTGPGGDPEVVPTERRSAFVLRAHGHAQSYVDLDDPHQLAFDYVRRLGDVLDGFRPPGAPVRIVHVGGAAMSLPRYVAATRPRSAQVVLEPDEAMTALVRERLPLPARSGIKVRPVDGRAGLEALRANAHEAVLVDAFAGGRVPGDLVTAEAFATAARVLEPGGLLLVNLVDRAPFAWARRAVAAARSAFPVTTLHAEQATLRGRRAGNVLLVASTTAGGLDGVAAHLQGSAGDWRVLAGTRVADSFGGGVPFSDADTAPSPWYDRP